MTEQETRDLWDLARVLHEARRDMAWGKSLGARREPWPEWSRSYSHAPIAYVDLALAQAKAVVSSRETSLAIVNLMVSKTDR